jgi:tetratricopeptide (TPR) repeat protein
MITLLSRAPRVPQAILCVAAACLFSPLPCFSQTPQSHSADPPQARALFRDAQQLASEGRLAEAEIPLSQAAVLAPTDIEVLTLLGKLQGRLGQYKDAVSAFQRILKLKPDVSENHLNLAIALADAGQLETALAETRAAIAIKPNSASAHLNRARLLADLHRPEEAEEEFRIASKLAPDNPDVPFYWALLARERQDKPKETRLLERLAVLQPSNDRAWFLLGRSLHEQSQAAESIAALRKAIALNPNAGDALYMLARELQPTDPDQAKELMRSFQKTRQRDANLDAVKALGNQAYAASSQKDWPEAIRLLRQALVQCDSCSIAAGLHRNLGLALCQNGQLQDGEDELQVALQLDPTDRDASAALNLLKK